MGRATKRQQAIMEMMFKVLAETKEATAAMSSFQQQTLASFEKMNLGIENLAKKTQRRVRTTTKQTQVDMNKIMAAPFMGGAGVSGVGRTMDDFILREKQMRGVTSGLRHEVGRIRNTLLLLVFATSGVVLAFKQWYQAIITAESALVGLKAVAINTGQSFEVLKNLSLEMEEKGFMSLGGTAAALKNLAASNMSMTESIQVLRALTDAAAFNRQGTLSMEEAIVGATQGIKNQNSIMIDNAGITKNISVMYREYAATIGKTSGSLTEMEKRHAIVNGIIHEASIFAGNAEKSLNAYQGRITKVQTTLMQMRRGLGEIIIDPIVGAIEKAVQSYTSIVAKGGLGRDIIKGVAETFGNAVTLITTFLEKLIGTIQFVDDSIKELSGGFLGLGKALDSPITKLSLFALALSKIGNYLSGVLTKMRVGTLETSFGIIKNDALKEAIILRRGYNIQALSGVDAAMVESRIINEMNQLLSKGNETLYIKEIFQKRINELIAIGTRSQAQELELQAKILALRKLGFDAVRQETTQKVGKTGSMKAGNLFWGPAGTVEPNKNQTKAFNAMIGESTRMHLGLFTKLKFELKAIGLEFARLNVVSKTFWLQQKTGAMTATQLVTSFGVALKGIGRSILNIGAIVGNVLGKIFLWVTLAQIAYELVKDLFDTKKNNYEQMSREIGLELKGIKGLNDSYLELSSTLKSRQEFFSITPIDDYSKAIEEINNQMKRVPSLKDILMPERMSSFAGLFPQQSKINIEFKNEGGKQFLDIAGRSGKTLRILSAELDGVNKQLGRYEITLLEIQETIRRGGSVDEEYFDKVQQHVEDLRTSYNALRSEIIETNDKINESQEFVIEQLEAWGNMATGTFSKMVKGTNDLFKQLQEIHSNRSFLEAMPIVDLDEQAYFGAFNRFEQLTQLAYRSHYRELGKIITEGENEISKIQKKALDLRLGNFRNSLIRQVVEIEKGYREIAEGIEQEMRKVNLERTNMEFEANLQKAMLGFQRIRSEADLYTKSLILNTKIMQLSSLTGGQYTQVLDKLTKQIDSYNLQSEKFKDQTGEPEKAFKSRMDILKKDAEDLRTFLIQNQEATLKLDSFLSDIQKYKTDRGFNIPEEDLEGITNRLNSLSTELGNLAKLKIPEVRIPLEDLEKLDLKNYLIIPEKFDLGPIREEVLKLKDDLISVGSSILTVNSEMLGAISFLNIIPQIIGELDNVNSEAKRSLDGMIDALSQYDDENLLAFSEKLRILKEDIIDTWEEELNFNKTLKSLNKTLETSATITKDYSNLYVDATGKLRMFGVEFINFQKELTKNEEESNIALRKLTRFFDVELTFLQKKFGNSGNIIINILKEMKKLLPQVFAKKLAMTNIESGFRILDSYIEKVSADLDDVNQKLETLSDVKDIQGFDFAAGLQKEISTFLTLERVLNQTKRTMEALSVIDPLMKMTEIDFDKVLSGLKNGIVKFMKENQETWLKEARGLQEDIKRSFGFDVAIGNVIGFNIQEIKKIEDWRDTLVDTLNVAKLLFPELTELVNNTIYSITELSKIKISGQVKDGIEEMINSLSQFSFQLGQLIQDSRFQVNELIKERDLAISEQQKLYTQGEITAMEKMKRIAELNQFYAKQIDQVWGQIGKTVLQSVANMGQQIIEEMVKQIAVAQGLKALEGGASSFAAAGAGFLAFLPFAPLIAGFGILTSMLSNVEQFEAPTFDETPQNQLTKFGGTIRAEEVNINITPTFIIEGQQIFIGSGSVVEYVEEATELMKQGVQQAIDNKEFSFDNIRALT